MAIRIPWDKYEVALLIETYKNVYINNFDKANEIHKLSKILRDKAIYSGVNIDETFRNINGIVMRLANIQFLFTNGTVGLSSYSKLDKEMYQMHQDNREVFDDILKEAKEIIVCNINRVRFFEWLEERVPPMQITKLHTVISEDNKYYQKKDYFGRFLFVLNDTRQIAKFEKTIYSDKILTDELNVSHSDIATMIECYRQFIEEENSKKSRENDDYRKHIAYVQSNTQLDIGQIDAISEEGIEAKEQQVSTQDGHSVLADDVNLRPYERLLKEKFPRGYRLNSSLELKKIRRFYLEVFNENLTDNDEEIQKNIRLVGIMHANRVYSAECMLSLEIKKNLLSYIRSSFDAGKEVIYFEALFEKFSNDFLNELIYNAEMLKSYLSYINEGEWICKKNYIIKEGHASIDLVQELRNFMVEYGLPVKINILCDFFSHIPTDKVKQILNQNPEFIYNASNEYFYFSIVDIMAEELEDIIEIIQDSISVNDYITGKELVNIIKNKIPKLIEKITEISEVGIRDVIKIKLENKFCFNGNIISSKDMNITTEDIFINYCKTHEEFTLSELKQLKIELNTNINFDMIYANSLRISKDIFVSKGRAAFDVLKTDEAIERFCHGNYLPIKKIRYFASFPDAGFYWTSYLLEHYVAEYSEKYKLLHIKFNENVCVGAIVDRNSNIQTFDDVLIEVLRESTKKWDKDTALDYLCEQGYIARRRYSNIENILIKARAKKG